MRSASLRHGRNRLIPLEALLLVWFVLCAGSEDASAEGLIERVSEALQQNLSQKEDGVPSFCRRQALCGRAVLEGFYRERGFRPQWMKPDGRSLHARGLVASIRKGSLEGLTPDVYHLAVIEALLESVDNALAAGKAPEAAVLADLEILLTDAFLIYGSHLLSGRVDPETLHTTWTVKARQADLAELLRAALEKGEVELALQRLLPRYPAYDRLREGLREYRAIRDRGGWQSVASGPTLREGDRDPRVPSLRARLIASGDMEEGEPAAPELFDEALGRAVRRFQALHGLAKDGAVGPETLTALNQPVEHRIRQIELNMERWRWLPEDLGRAYILVNTAGFFLKVVEEGREVLAMRVVAGRKYRRTPVFTGTMTYLVLNPTWEVPHSIAVRDILPKVKEDPRYLDRQGIRVFGSWSDSASAILPGTIDWTAVTRHSFAYRLRQDPGPANALGRVKFMLPNRFAVYLHDTPQRNLFERSRRDFSSGCIRVEAPVDLAAYVLRGNPKWTREAILSAIESGKTRTVLLPEPIPVHLLYWTAWADAEGDICFCDDVYGRDGPLDEALKEGPLGYQ